MIGALVIALCAVTVDLVYGQYEGWVPNQVNASIVLWSQPRGRLIAYVDSISADANTAAVIRDTVYLDGGFIYWAQGLSDGTYGAIESNGLYILIPLVDFADMKSQTTEWASCSPSTSANHSGRLIM